MPAKFVVRLSREELERRRMVAAQQLRDGASKADVARTLHVNESSVSRWNRALQRHGVEGLRRRTAPGKSSKLTDAQWSHLEGILVKGAEAYGFSTDLWTGPRVQRVIKDEFGVQYNWRYLDSALRTRLDLSWQKPRRVARERNDARRKEWLDTTWRELKKGHKKGAGRSRSSTSPGSR